MTLISGIIAIAVLYFALQMFRQANPAVMARGIRMGGGIVSLAVAVFVGLRGELAVAIPLGFFGAGLLGWSPMSGGIGKMFGGRASRLSGQTSRVRSSFLDMTLDHDNGTLTGQIIAGAEQGRSLDEFDLEGLLRLRVNFDDESRGLLEAYLDRRFSGWRQDSQEDSAAGSRGRFASKMTDEEAYEILGLKPGAGRDDITRAHRTLMKKLHPDQGGTTYLAARVNEAKDTLLRRHGS